MEPNLSDQGRAGTSHATSIEIKLVGVARGPVGSNRSNRLKAGPVSDLCRQATKARFFQLHTVLKLFFNDIIIFQTRHR